MNARPISKAWRWLTSIPRYGDFYSENREAGRGHSAIAEFAEQLGVTSVRWHHSLILIIWGFIRKGK